MVIWELSLASQSSKLKMLDTKYITRQKKKLFQTLQYQSYAVYTTMTHGFQHQWLGDKASRSNALNSTGKSIVFPLFLAIVD